MKDIYGRNIDYLRISVIDKCNLKCVYCIPEEGICYYQQEELLSDEELLKIVLAAAKIGIKKIKITGGEPLLRKGLVELIRKMYAIQGIEQITMTTNGVLLSRYAKDLKEAGLVGLNLSLDTMDAKSYAAVTLKDCLDQVLEGLEKALEVGLKVKLNCVPIVGINDGEIMELVKRTENLPVILRFIELMPIGLGKQYKPVLKEDLMEQLEARYKGMELCSVNNGNGPATYYQFKGRKESIGFISALSSTFCQQCNRVRLTANGYLKLCLHYNLGVDLKTPLRSGVTGEELQELLEKHIYQKVKGHQFEDARGSHIEMHHMIQIGG